MKSIKLSESDCSFIHHVLRRYANRTEGLEREDQLDIYEIANKFKL